MDHSQYMADVYEGPSPLASWDSTSHELKLYVYQLYLTAYRQMYLALENLQEIDKMF